MIKKLCILSSYYPSEQDPHYAFVGTLVEAIADMGIDCIVISPCSWIEKKHKSKTRIEHTKNGNIIKVYCPRFFVFPNRNILGFKTYRLTSLSENRAVQRTFRRKVKHCDAIYSHFISSGVSAALLSKKTKIPAFMACGESNIYSASLIYDLFKEELKKHLNGIIAVSSELKDNINKIGIAANGTPIKVIPNAIDTNSFYVKDRACVRKEKGFPHDAFIVAFVGGFIKRKGFDVLQDVLKKHKEWKCILIGGGDIPLVLEDDQVLFCGKLSHDRIADYLNCADVFVLPTLEEGCCNAIIEAMGCGLPIISSNRKFNTDILNPDVSIMVDPTDKDEIEKAIQALYFNSVLKKTMSKNAAIHSKNFSIGIRSQAIVSFIEENSNL